MANYFKEGRCAFEECTQLGFDMFGFAQHVHNFGGRLLKTRMNARGHRRNAQWPLHLKNQGFIHAQTDGGYEFGIAHVCTCTVWWVLTTTRERL